MQGDSEEQITVTLSTKFWRNLYALMADFVTDHDWKMSLGGDRELTIATFQEIGYLIGLADPMARTLSLTFPRNTWNNIVDMLEPFCGYDVAWSNERKGGLVADDIMMGDSFIKISDCLSGYEDEV